MPVRQCREYNVQKSKESFDRARVAGQKISAATPSDKDQIEVDYFNVVKVSIPWSGNLSKNRILGRGMQGNELRVFLKSEGRKLRAQIALLIKSEMRKRGISFVDGKVWLDLFVQKPNAGAGDAVNVIDMISDAVQDAIGVNDKWYCIKCLDWEVKKVDPQIFIEVGQGDSGPQKICSYCGVIRSLDRFNKTPKGISDMCSECRKR